DLASKYYFFIIVIPIQRFYSKVIPGDEQLAFSSVENDKGKHTVEQIDKLVAQFQVHVQNDLCIRRCAEFPSFSNQIFTQLDVVIYFTIKYDSTVLNRHWLLARGKVDNGKALVKKTDRAFRQHTFLIGATVMDGGCHVFQ